MEYSLRSVSTPDFEMEYITFGSSGRPLCIIPGASVTSVLLSADAIVQAYEVFSEQWTVYLFDRKKNIGDSYSMEEIAADTAAAMRIIGIGDADLIGISQGGMIAQYIAIDYPELVHKLVLGSTFAKPNSGARVIFGKWIKSAVEQNIAQLNRSFFEKVFSEEFQRSYREVLASMEHIGTSEDMRRFAVLVQSILDFDVTDKISGIKCPMLVLGSKKDRIISEAALTDIARLTGCEIYLYEGYGHAVYDEAPDFKDRIIDFLKK